MLKYLLSKWKSRILIFAHGSQEGAYDTLAAEAERKWCFIEFASLASIWMLTATYWKSLSLCQDNFPLWIEHCIFFTENYIKIKERMYSMHTYYNKSS